MIESGRPFAGPVVLGLDIGGTQIRAAAIAPSGERLARRAVATPMSGEAEAIYAACSDLLKGVRADLPAELGARLVAVGVSSMGPLDSWRGVVVDPPNVAGLRDAPLADVLEDRVGMPVYLERDTNVAALAEHWLGAARGCRDFMYVTVSTGLGGSIYREGRLLLGPDGTAGEVGHVCLMPYGGPRCGCGGRGHLEALASGSGLANAATDALAAGAGDRAAGRNVARGASGRVPAAGGVLDAVDDAAAVSPFLAARALAAPITGKDVAEGELEGDPVCTGLMRRARLAFAIACVGWVNAFNPERIVVGGTVAERQGERWLEPARAAVSSTGFRAPASRVRIVAAELGADVGLVGAWPLVEERHGDPIWRERRARS